VLPRSKCSRYVLSLSADPRQAKQKQQHPRGATNPTKRLGHSNAKLRAALLACVRPRRSQAAADGAGRSLPRVAARPEHAMSARSVLVRAGQIQLQRLSPSRPRMCCRPPKAEIDATSRCKSRSPARHPTKRCATDFVVVGPTATRGTRRCFAPIQATRCRSKCAGTPCDHASVRKTHVDFSGVAQSRKATSAKSH